MEVNPSHSLRARLFWLLLLSIVLVAVTQSYIAYRTVLNQTDAVFDYHMQQMIVALRPALPATPTLGADKAEQKKAEGDFLIRIWKSDGTRVFDSTGKAALPQLAKLGFSNVNAGGTTYRVLSVQVESQTIQVAQDLAVRSAMAKKIALRTIAPIALMAPVLIFLAFWVVTRSLSPVSRVRRQVAERQVSDLSPINETGLPDEISPLVKELNLLLTRVRDAFETQQHFVADAAHELRSPLAALKLQTHGLQHARDDASRDVAIRRLAAGIDRATRLVEQLLILARQESSAGDAQKPQSISLADTCRTVLTEIATMALERKIDIGLGHADDVRIDGYPEALRILVRNLLDNAVKYSPAGGRVDVEVRAASSVVELSVDDSGPGIPAEHRARVLDRFYRLHDGGTVGSGLGLAIVKSIAEHHGAELSLTDSASLGGLRVVVRFPMSRAA